MLDWPQATPADIVAAASKHPNALALFVSDQLKNSPDWAAIDASARPTK
jgi:hypothetical protein